MTERFAMCPHSVCKDFINDLCCSAANRDAIACGLDTPAKSNIIGAAAPRWCRHTLGTKEHAMLRPLCSAKSNHSKQGRIVTKHTLCMLAVLLVTGCVANTSAIGCR